MRYNRQIDAYSVETSKGEYIVTVERLKNDINGNGRAEYHVIPIGSDCAYVYRGSFLRGGILESAEAVKRYEQDLL